MVAISKPAPKHYPQMATGHSNDFQSPEWVITPLLPYLPPRAHIWEPAQGKGNLCKAFTERGFTVWGSDVLTGTDFLTYTPEHLDSYAAIITNPPYTLKDKFIARCYALKRPWALLLPVTALTGAKRQVMYEANGIEVILIRGRVNFLTPSGIKGSAWYEVAWFTWGLGIGQALTFAPFPGPKKERELTSPVLSPVNVQRDIYDVLQESEV